MTPRRVAAACLLTSALAGVQVVAHEMGTTRVSVVFHDDRRYEIEIVTDAAALLDKLETTAGRQASIGERDAAPAVFANRLAALDAVFRSRLIVAFDEVGDRPATEYAVSPWTDLSAPVATIRLTGKIPATAREFKWAYFWTFTTYALSVRATTGDDPVVESLESGQTSTPFDLGFMRRTVMSRWPGYVMPLMVIALSSFVGWCAWPQSRLSADAARARDILALTRISRGVPVRGADTRTRTREHAPFREIHAAR